MTDSIARRGPAVVLFLLLAAIALLLSGLVGTASAQPAAAAAAHSVGFKFKSFHTPSGNIVCGIVKSGGRWSIRCDTYEHNWSPPPKNCQEGDNAGSIGVGGKSRPRFICVSDAISPTGQALAYGNTIDYGPFHCKSKRSGLKCYNKLGKGFKVSRESYRFWY